jgi:hypothetical protein
MAKTICKTDRETDKDYGKLPDKQEITGESFGLANSGYGISDVLREVYGISEKITATTDGSCYRVITGCVWRV